MKRGLESTSVGLMAPPFVISNETLASPAGITDAELYGA